MASSSSHSHSLKALAVFRNLMHPELIRTVHVYRLEEGAEEEVEREYVLHKDGDYEEIGLCKVLTHQAFRISAQFEGLVNGVWLCIYVFDDDRHCPPDLDRIPAILSISSLSPAWRPNKIKLHFVAENPKLESIPTLANDLHIIYQLSTTVENSEPSQIPTEEPSEGNNDNNHQLRGSRHVSGLDLNSFPYLESENEETGRSGSGVVERKKKRAATKDIARLALEDLAKYFDLPIVEASKNLNVGLTVLKKKCREFGIPRWPHRKIKSLDSLIRDLQEEVERQQEDKAAAMVVTKRQRMIESEKESIERKPFMEIQSETKKFRQDIFKKKHRARVIEGQSRTLSLF